MPESVSMRGLRRLAAALAAVAFAVVCGRGGDPVRGTLDRMASAAHDRDAAALMNQLTEDFRAADGSGRSEVEALVRRTFAGYETLDVTLADVEIERSATAARARFRTRLSGRPRAIAGLEGLVPSSASYRFDVRLTRQGRVWKAAWASWNPEEGS